MKKSKEKKNVNKKFILLGIILMIIAIIAITVIVFFLIHNSNNNGGNDNSTIEEKISISAEKYLSLNARKYDFLSVLSDKEYGLGFYNSKEEAKAIIKDSELLVDIDGILFNLYKTDINYNEYKNKILEYVSEEIFKKEFEKYGRNVEGFLYIVKTMDLDVHYSVDNIVITKQEGNKYEFEISTVPSDYPVSDIFILFYGKAEKNKDGNFVITEIKLKEDSEEIINDEVPEN